MAADDEDLWAPFLVFRPTDRRAALLREHARDLERRGRRPPRRLAALSRDDIVRAAIAVADAEGADAINMRRIAREVNAGTMSLYWHVASKEELLDLMIDAVQGELPPPEPSGDWRQDLRVMGCAMRSTLHRHRWMMEFLGGRPPTGPKSLQNVERALACLDGLDLDRATAITIVMTVGTYVLGGVLREVQEMNGEAYQRLQFAGLSEGEKEALIREFTDRIRDSGRYPHLIAVMDSGVDPDAAQTRDARFEFGFDCLLDGIAARVPVRGPAPGSAPAPGNAPTARADAAGT